MYAVIKNTIIVMLAFLYALTAGCSTNSKAVVQKAPVWVSTPSAAYPDAVYLSAVGYAPSRSDAEAAAAAVLIKSVSQKVEAAASSVQTMQAGDQNVHRFFSSVIHTASTVDEITGLTIKETWSSTDGTVYTLALINREEVGTHYEAKIKAAEDGINALIVFAAENPASLEAVSALNKAAHAAAENEKSLSLLSVIHPGKYKKLSLAYKNMQTVQTLLYREIEKISIAVHVENDKNRRIAAAFLQALKEAGFKTQTGSANSETPVKTPYVLNAALIFEPFEGKNTSENIYVRYNLSAELTDMRTGKIVLPWSSSGREAHFTQTEAENRAVRTLENNIKERYLKDTFSALLK